MTLILLPKGGIFYIQFWKLLSIITTIINYFVRILLWETRSGGNFWGIIFGIFRDFFRNFVEICWIFKISIGKFEFQKSRNFPIIHKIFQNKLSDSEDSRRIVMNQQRSLETYEKSRN